MWLVSDEAMRGLLGGEFCQVVIAKQTDPDVSIKKLYDYQFNYFSYQGFRKFFKSRLIKVLNGIKFLDDNEMSSKLIKKMARLNNDGEKKNK